MSFTRTLLAFAGSLVGLVLVLPVLVLALPFLVVSALTRVIARILEPSYLTVNQLIQFDPHVGWKPIPNLNTHHLLVDFFHLTTDADGWRGAARLDQSDLIVFGDSFAAGYGVNERDLYANLLPRPRIKPVAIGGYSMVQELLWMERLAGFLHNKLVVWFVFYGNDLYDNLSPDLRGYRKPFLRKNAADEWEIVSSHVRSERWPIVTRKRMFGHHHPPKLAELCSEGFLSQRAYSACEFLVRQARDLCARVGAELVLLTIPDPLQMSEAGTRRLRSLGGDPRTFDVLKPDREFEAIANALNVRMISGRSFLDSSCYKTNDCHWNVHGHRKVAEFLARLHEESRRSHTQAPRQSASALVHG
jgi:hypothetical protein